MTDILIALGALGALAVILLILIYNRLDRLRFFLDRRLKAARPLLDQWAACCERLAPGSSEEYRRAKKGWDVTAQIRDLAEAVPGQTEEKLSLQETLLDFCHSYNPLAERYNRALGGPLSGRLGPLLGFRPYALIDFYPDVPQPGERSNAETE